MFSQTVEYALRAVVYLAGEAPEPRTTDQVAAATRVPKAYLSKVLQGWSTAGLVHSRAGSGGGMTLAKPPEELTILEVVNAVEPIGRIATCPLGLASHGVNLCPLHRRLDAPWRGRGRLPPDDARRGPGRADLQRPPLRLPDDRRPALRKVTATAWPGALYRDHPLNHAYFPSFALVFSRRRVDSIERTGDGRPCPRLFLMKSDCDQIAALAGHLRETTSEERVSR